MEPFTCKFMSSIQCGTVLPTDVNHVDDPMTKEKLKAMINRRNQISDEPQQMETQIMKEYFADKI